MKYPLLVTLLSLLGACAISHKVHAASVSAPTPAPAPLITVPPDERRTPDDKVRIDRRDIQDPAREDPLKLGPYPGIHMRPVNVPEYSVVGPQNWTSDTYKTVPKGQLRTSNITTVPEYEDDRRKIAE